MAEIEIRSESKPNCLLCGSRGESLYEQVVDPYFGAAGYWNVKRCASTACGLVWLDPRPSVEDLHLAYKSYFTHADEPGSRGPRLREILYSGYRAGMALPALLVGLRPEQLALESMYLDDLQPGKLLDVGCGDGQFLARMRRKGWVPSGVDFDEAAIRSAKTKYGLNLDYGDLASAHFPDKCFDAVTLNHVIEHVPDPVALLREVRRVTVETGRVVIATPNANSQGHALFQRHWFGLDAPRHLQLFNPTNLRAAAERAGLKVFRSFSTAARADIFFGASESIQAAVGQRSESHPPPALMRTLRAVRRQFAEHFSRRTDVNAGEEVVLVATAS